MAGTKNDTLIGKNADFSQVGGPNATSSDTNGLNTNGQMWIGSTATNVGGTHINVGTLTSPDSSITFGYSSPNITATVTGGSTSVIKLTGNSGVATPSAGNINVITANSTVKFVGSGATLTQDFAAHTLAVDFLLLGTNLVGTAIGLANVGLGRLSMGASVTNVSNNTAIGDATLGSVISSSSNSAGGANSLSALTTGNGSNTGWGVSTLSFLQTGQLNSAFGFNAGLNYTSSESSNIVIGNTGTTGESNVMRLGTQGSGAGQQNKCFIAGIVGVTNSNPQLVTVNSSTGQLGVTTSSQLLWNVVSTNQTGATSNGYIFVSPGGALTISLPTTSAIGDEFSVVLDGATSWQITQAAGQQIRLASSTTTLGATGSLTSTAQGNSVTLVCRVANTTWTAISSIGNITVA